MGAIRTVFRLVGEGDFRAILDRTARKLGMDPVPPLPTSLYIETNNTCDLRCPLCPVGQRRMNRPPRHMRVEEFRGIIDQVAGSVRDIWIPFYGEPFLHGGLFRMIRYAADRGIVVQVSTNGTALASDRVRAELLDSGLHLLSVALDGADQETLSKYRVGADFDAIVRGVRQLLELRRSRNLATPRVELQFITMKHNEHQLGQVRALARTLGVDLFSDKTVGVDCRDRAVADKFLPADLSRSRYRRNDDGSYSLKGDMTNRCDWLRTTCVINSDGTVVPCCYDAESAHVMGNAFETPLGRIWRGRKYTRFRRQVRKRRKEIPMCNICSSGRYSISEQTNVDRTSAAKP